jgi:myo-inositol 2-dehydrogenase / D-chiro-inositol 1-dehydrogenase
MLAIAVLGAGRIGRIHAANVAAHPRVRLAGVFDIDHAVAESVAGQLGSRRLDLDAAFGADAVMICSPTPTHADYIERAASMGRPVFCEKPIDLDVPRARACLNTVRATGGRLMIGFNRRFDPHFSALKARIDAGVIGAVELLTITSRDPAPPPIGFVKSSGGLFRDMMIHDLDMACFLLDEQPAAVSAVGSCLVDAAIAEAGDVDTAAVILRMGSGRICQISNSRRATYGYDQRIEVHGATGMLRVGNVLPTTVEHADAHGYRTDPALPFFLERYAAAYQAELDAFIGAIEDNSPMRPGGEDGLRALLLADAAEASVLTGRIVQPVREGPA